MGGRGRRERSWGGERMVAGLCFRGALRQRGAMTSPDPTNRAGALAAAAATSGGAATAGARAGAREKRDAWTGPVLLFDGECGLCNRIVRVLLRIDGGGRLRFAPLQGTAAQGYLRAQGLPTEDFDSLVFVPAWAAPGCGAYRLRTDGVIAALRALGGAGRALAAVLAVWPAGWRDAGYRVVARWRYRMLGEWRPRPLARAEWAERFFE